LEKDEKIMLTLDDLTQPFQTKNKHNPRLDSTSLSQYLDVIKQPFAYGEELIEDNLVANIITFKMRYGNSTKCKSSSTNIYFETLIVCNNNYLFYQNQIGEFFFFNLTEHFKLHPESEINEAQILLDDRIRALITVSHPEDSNKTTLHYMEEPIKAPFDKQRINYTFSVPILITKNDEKFKFIPLYPDINQMYVVNKRLTIGYFWNGSNLIDLKPYNFESFSLVKAFELNLTFLTPNTQQNQTIINSVFAVQGQGQSIVIYYCMIEKLSFKCLKKSEGALTFQIGDYLKFGSQRSMFVRQEFREKHLFSSVKTFNTLSHLNDRLEPSQIREIFFTSLNKNSMKFKPEMDVKVNSELLVLTYPTTDEFSASRAIHIKDFQTGASFTDVISFWTFSLLGRRVRLFYQKGFTLIDSAAGLLSISRKKSYYMTFPFKISYGSFSIGSEKLVNNLKINFTINPLNYVSFELPKDITLYAGMKQEITFFESEIVGNDIDIYMTSELSPVDENYVTYKYSDRLTFNFWYNSTRMNISQAKKIIVSNEYGFAIQIGNEVKYYFKCNNNNLGLVVCQRYIIFKLPEDYLVVAFETFRDSSNFFAIGRQESVKSLVFISIYFDEENSSNMFESNTTNLTVTGPIDDFAIYDVEDLNNSEQGERSSKIVLLYTIKNRSTLSYWRIDLKDLSKTKESVFGFNQINQKPIANFCPRSLFYSHLSDNLYVTSCCYFEENRFEKFKVYTFQITETVSPIILKISKESDFELSEDHGKNREFCIFEEKVFIVNSNDPESGFHLFRGFNNIETRSGVKEILPKYSEKSKFLLGYRCMSNENLLITIMGNSTELGSDVLIFVYDMKKTLDTNSRLIKMIEGYKFYEFDFSVIKNNELLLIYYGENKASVTMFELRKFSLKVIIPETNESELQLKVNVKNKWLSSHTTTRIIIDPETGHLNLSVKGNSSYLKTNTIYPIEEFFKYEGTMDNPIEFKDSNKEEKANIKTHDSRLRLITRRELPTQTWIKNINLLDWVHKHNETSLIVISYLQESTNFILFDDALTNRSSNNEIHLYQTRQSCEIPKLISMKTKSTTYSVILSSCLRSYLRELKVLIYTETQDKKEKSKPASIKDIIIGDFDFFHAFFGNKDSTILITLVSNKRSKVCFYTLDIDLSENLLTSTFDTDLLYELYDSRLLPHFSICLHNS